MIFLSVTKICKNKFCLINQVPLVNRYQVSKYTLNRKLIMINYCKFVASVHSDLIDWNNAF